MSVKFVFIILLCFRKTLINNSNDKFAQCQNNVLNSIGTCEPLLTLRKNLAQSSDLVQSRYYDPFIKMYCILIMDPRDQHIELSSRSTRLWIGVAVSIGISQVIIQKAWLWIIVVACLESVKLSLHTKDLFCRFVNSRSIVTTTKG
jgi:hypothetical protein